MAHSGSIFLLHPLDKRGEKILDELEAETRVGPIRILEDGQREYHLNSAGPDGFDAMLNQNWPDWGEHVGRVPTGA
jgi:hypothetical protein